MNTVQIVFVLCLGAAFGSFANVLIYRLPLGLSIVRPRSFCPSCRRQLRWYENIPLVSFLMLGARCAHCRKPISWRYPLVEAIAAGGALYFFLRHGWDLAAVAHFLLLFGLIVASGTDLAAQVIPDAVTLPGIVLGIAWHANSGAWLTGIVGAAAGGGLLLAIRLIGGLVYRKEVMGMGDVLLAAMIGAFTGFPQVIAAVFIAALLGAVVGIAYLTLTRRSRSTPIPFGPFLAAGGLIGVIASSPVSALIRRLVAG